jgi:hypothetical protein
MAAAVTRTQLGVCAQPRSHAGYKPTRRFVGIASVVRGQPVDHAAAFFRQATWLVLSDRACVRADLDGWKPIGGKVSTR